MNFKKFRRVFIAAVMACITFSMTVFAEPSVDALQDQKSETEKQIRDLETQMTGIMKDINETEEGLVRVGSQVIQAKEDLKKAQEQEQKQYNAMKNRIVIMYENGNTSMLQMIFEAGNISEMLKQAENVRAIHEYDRKQLDEYVKIREKIEELKTSLEKDQAYLESKQKSLEARKAELESTINAAKSSLTDIDAAIQTAFMRATRNNHPDTSYVPPVGTGGGAAIVAEAYKYLGVPYVWGGASASGVDCSGLVLLAHRAIGVKLAHYSGTIGSGGRAVARGDEQPGDVVCYSGHVAIYIGGGQMIHAPQPGDHVRIANVYGNPWYRRYW